jgi:hypothetical protein
MNDLFDIAFFRHFSGEISDTSPLSHDPGKYRVVCLVMSFWHYSSLSAKYVT